jgi:2-polyprenyl-3-methyl-5-hydroxy-6-metoxy-1,4-benzoquinol methylase
MKKKSSIRSQEFGLELASLVGKQLYNINHLHYGYWDDGVDVNLNNLKKAQDRYCNLVKSTFPGGVRNILDVGAGSGEFAKSLLKDGYMVDCVSPGEYLSEQISEKLGPNVEVFQCFFEQLQTDKKYDLIMFSESFQYIDIESGFMKAISLLKPGGHILICDFFKRDKRTLDGKSPLSGGHKIVKFNKVVNTLPVQKVREIDITKYTAPNITLVNEMLGNIGIPAVKLFNHYLDHNFLLRAARSVVSFMYKKRLAKFERKYLTGERNAENFEKYKQYLLLLYKA